MINQTIQSNMTIHKHLPYSMRLKAAREALGMDRKEAASQLRLSEQIIIMLENGEFKTDLPLTFIRGYIRSYSKLLSIPESEVQEALELLQPLPLPEEKSPPHATTHSALLSPRNLALSVTIGNFFVKFFTYLIAMTLLVLVGIWWHGTKKTTNTIIHTFGPVSAVSNKSITLNTVNAPATVTSDNAKPPLAEDLPLSTNGPKNASANPTPAKQRLSTFYNTLTTFLHRSDKTAFTQFALGNNLIQLLSSLILFLLILTIGLRVYSNNSITGNSRHASKLTAKPLFIDFSYPYFDFKKIALISTLLLLVAFIGFGSLHWYRHHSGLAALPNPAQPNSYAHKTAAPSALPAINLDLGPLNADMTVLAPLPQFKAVLVPKYAITILQNMLNQLDDYIAQAALLKFSLTDPSTPLGQFKKYKKKHYRKHYRPAYLRYGENEVTHFPANNVIYP